MLQEEGHSVLCQPGGEEGRENTVRDTFQQGKEVVSIKFIHKSSLKAEGGGTHSKSTKLSTECITYIYAPEMLTLLTVRYDNS